MTHQEGQPEELVLSQAEQETIEEELLDAVTGGAGIKDFFRGCASCFKPQTQETAARPGSPEASVHSAVHSAQPDFTIRSLSRRHNLTQAEVDTMTHEGIIPPLGSRFEEHSAVFPRNPNLQLHGR